MLCLNFWCPVSSAAVMQSSLIGAMMLPGLPLRTMASSKNGRADGKKVMECNGQEIEQRWCGERLICQTVKSHWDACIISCDCHTSPFFRNTFFSSKKLLLSCIPCFLFFVFSFNSFFNGRWKEGYGVQWTEIEQRWCRERQICQIVKPYWNAYTISYDSHTSHKRNHC